jgi:hypothetical protein
MLRFQILERLDLLPEVILLIRSLVKVQFSLGEPILQGLPLI